MVQVWTNTDIDGPVNTHQYDISLELENGVGYSLYRSNNPDWTAPGEWVASIKEDGDKVVISHGDTEILFEYHEVEEILALLLVSHKDKMELRHLQTVKSI